MRNKVRLQKKWRKGRKEGWIDQISGKTQISRIGGRGCKSTFCRLFSVKMILGKDKIAGMKTYKHKENRSSQEKCCLIQCFGK